MSYVTKINYLFFNKQTVLSGDVWTMISMAVDLNNVTLELLTSHKVEPGMPEVSLAKLDFIRSRLSYDLFSDQSKETDLVSKEILASDTRFRGKCSVCRMLLDYV